MATSPAKNRHDAVLIRVSTQGQDQMPQIANCKNLLAARNIEVPDKYWYQFKVSRRKVLTGPGFEQVMDEVRAGKIRDIYVESQDRFGGKSNKELFSVLKVCQDHFVRVFDLTNNRELTSDEFIDEIQTLFEGMKSVKELKDTSRRSIRSRVNNFKEKHSWPNGGAPFGFGKQCSKPTGVVKFGWYPISNRSKGEVWYAGTDGKLTLGDTDTRIPRKEKEDLTFLLPHHDKRILESVKRVFDLFANHGLSFRQIADWLNKDDFTYYGKPFNFGLIREIVHNPSYVGDTVFGKRQTGEYYSFDGEANVLELGKNASAEQLAAAKQSIAIQDTHQGIISRKLWNLAQTKIANDLKDRSEGKTRLPARQATFYLKNLLRCGHCGKGMTGRSETQGDRKPKYVCGSYNAAGSNKQPCECGFQTISHELAEELIFEKLKELGIKKAEVTGKREKKAMQKRITSGQLEQELSEEQFVQTIDEGVEALTRFLKENYDLTPSELSAITKRLRRFYKFGKLTRREQAEFPIAMGELRKAIREAEQQAVSVAVKKLEALKAEHQKLTVKWALMEAVRQNALDATLKEMEAEILILEAKSKTVSERLREYWASYEEWREDHETLMDEFANMDFRVKGESLRRIFESIELFWDKEWHEQESVPSRERKTSRPGRWAYTLNKSKIVWKTRGLDMITSW